MTLDDKLRKEIDKTAEDLSINRFLDSPDYRIFIDMHGTESDVLSILQSIRSYEDEDFRRILLDISRQVPVNPKSFGFVHEVYYDSEISAAKMMYGYRELFSNLKKEDISMSTLDKATKVMSVYTEKDQTLIRDVMKISSKKEDSYHTLDALFDIMSSEYKDLAHRRFVLWNIHSKKLSVNELRNKTFSDENPTKLHKYAAAAGVILGVGLNFYANYMDNLPSIIGETVESVYQTSIFSLTWGMTAYKDMMSENILDSGRILKSILINPLFGCAVGYIANLITGDPGASYTVGAGVSIAATIFPNDKSVGERLYDSTIGKITDDKK